MFAKIRQGFTLIELMIVVAIIGILAAIAIPNFLKFQCKSKTSESKAILKGIYTANVAYFGESENFTNLIGLFGLDGVAASANNGTGKYFTYVVASGATTFTAVATAQAGGAGAAYGTFNIGYYGSNDALNGMIRTSINPCT